MTKERAKELLPIIQAYAEGKKIQVESHNHKWFDVTELDDDFESLNYRIKPEDDTEITSVQELKDRFNEWLKKGHKECDSYRPFKSCNELIYHWERKKFGYSANPLQMVDIWVKHKVDGRRRMIVGFGDNFVEVGVKAKPVTLERLFEMYTFLDGNPCGVCE